MEHTRGYLIPITSNRFKFKPILPNEQFRRVRVIWTSYYNPSDESALLLNISGIDNSNLINVGDDNCNRFSFCFPIRQSQFVTHSPTDIEWFDLPCNPSLMNWDFDLWYSRENLGFRPRSDIDITEANPCMVYLQFST